MKTPLKSIVCCALCVAAGTSFAQQSTYDTTPATERSHATTREAGESQKFCKSKDLVGADVTDLQGNKLGDIEDIYISPKTGETFASIEVSGSRHALVPIQAFNVTRQAGLIRNAQLKLDATKQTLESGPTVAKDQWSRLDRPGFVQSIYSHYKVQPTAMGGSESGYQSGATKGAGTSDDEKEEQHEQHEPHEK